MHGSDAPFCTVLFISKPVRFLSQKLHLNCRMQLQRRGGSMPLPNSDKIRELNDKFRKGEDTSMPGKIVLTSGLLYLLEENDKASEDIVLLVRDFDEFTEDNDPHKEHDFGAFDFCGAKIFWKFDYYDPDIMHGSSDASDITKTFRMLTVFLGSEY